jgi:hypothetical protein
MISEILRSLSISVGRVSFPSCDLAIPIAGHTSRRSAVCRSKGGAGSRPLVFLLRLVLLGGAVCRSLAH